MQQDFRKAMRQTEKHDVFDLGKFVRKKIAFNVMVLTEQEAHPVLSSLAWN